MSIQTFTLSRSKNIKKFIHNPQCIVNKRISIIYNVFLFESFYILWMCDGIDRKMV